MFYCLHLNEFRSMKLLNRIKNLVVPIVHSVTPLKYDCKLQFCLSYPTFKEKDVQEVELPRDVDGYVVVYTDGSCLNNGKPNAAAGIGVWFGDGHPLNVSKPVRGEPTNNKAEIQACIKAINIAKKYDIKKLKIFTDSQYVTKAITEWIHNWRANSWKNSAGKEVQNKVDFVKLYKAAKCIEDIKWIHVEGHTGCKGNEEANNLAKTGASKYKPIPTSQ